MRCRAGLKNCGDKNYGTYISTVIYLLLLNTSKVFMKYQFIIFTIFEGRYNHHHFIEEIRSGAETVKKIGTAEIHHVIVGNPRYVVRK